MIKINHAYAMILHARKDQENAKKALQKAHEDEIKWAQTLKELICSDSVLESR